MCDLTAHFTTQNTVFDPLQRLSHCHNMVFLTSQAIIICANTGTAIYVALAAVMMSFWIYEAFCCLNKERVSSAERGK
jgi:hypothetical protein